MPLSQAQTKVRKISGVIELDDSPLEVQDITTKLWAGASGYQEAGKNYSPEIADGNHSSVFVGEDAESAIALFNDDNPDF